MSNNNFRRSEALGAPATTLERERDIYLSYADLKKEEAKKLRLLSLLSKFCAL